MMMLTAFYGLPIRLLRVSQSGTQGLREALADRKVWLLGYFEKSSNKAALRAGVRPRLVPSDLRGFWG